MILIASKLFVYIHINKRAYMFYYTGICSLKDFSFMKKEIRDIRIIKDKAYYLNSARIHILIFSTKNQKVTVRTKALPNLKWIWEERPSFYFRNGSQLDAGSQSTKRVQLFYTKGWTILEPQKHELQVVRHSLCAALNSLRGENSILSCTQRTGRIFQGKKNK